jgi:formate hydrogenlyase transcriptional activator
MSTGRRRQVFLDLAANVGRMTVGPKGASCGTAVYRKEPVYVTDILTDPIWDDYRTLVLPYGIRSVWSRPLFTSEGKAEGRRSQRQE